MNYYFYPGNDDVFFDALTDINNNSYTKQGVFVRREVYKNFDKRIVRFRNRLSFHSKKSDPLTRLYDDLSWLFFSGIKDEIEIKKESCYVFSNLTIKLIPYRVLRKLSLDKNSHLVLYFLDSSNNPLCFEALELAKCVKFDAVFTFDKKDANKYGFRHIYYIYSKIEQISNTEHQGFICRKKIGFWGSDKGRVPLLANLSKIFSKYNISYFYSIVGVKNTELVKDNNITINNPIPYREMINRLQDVDIILDVVVPGQSGLSYRAVEAVCYNKKLLSNNPSIVEFPYYDKRYMRYFDSIEDIDIDFLNNNTKVDYKYHNEYSPVQFLRIIASIVE